MKIIAPSVNKEGLQNLLTEEKFCDTEIQQNRSVESFNLRPWLHLKAPEYLKEKSGSKVAVLTQVDCLFKSLRDQKAKVENQNKDIKANHLQNKRQRSARKLNLNHLRKHH